MLMFYAAARGKFQEHLSSDIDIDREIVEDVLQFLQATVIGSWHLLITRFTLFDDVSEWKRMFQKLRCIFDGDGSRCGEGLSADAVPPVETHFIFCGRRDPPMKC